MSILDPSIINIIGITAYMSMFICFIWVAQIPGATQTGPYWLGAIILIMLARFNLLFMSDILTADIVNLIYAVLLVLEKYFLVSGLLIFFDRSSIQRQSKSMFLTLTACFCLGLIMLSMVEETVFLFIFSLSQSIAFLAIAYLIFTDYKKVQPKGYMIACGIFVVYSLHWLTFPIAKNYPAWLAWGFLFGNLLNLICYAFYLNLELSSFRDRLLSSEKDAKELADNAISASKAKSEFLANMSHEIRTPMNGILGMLNLLKRSSLTDKQSRKLEIAIDSANSLLTILNDILDFSKIESGKLNINPIECDLEKEVDAISQLIAPIAENKGLQLEVSVEKNDIHSIRIDPTRFGQILNNLLSNAIKFTQTGTIQLVVETKNKDSGTLVSGWVKDEGIGIDADKLDILFDAFQQEDGSTTRKYGGTRLGLSICKQLCQLMGGDIYVESEKGKGSCFYFSFPTSHSS